MQDMLGAMRSGNLPTILTNITNDKKIVNFLSARGARNSSLEPIIIRDNRFRIRMIIKIRQNYHYITLRSWWRVKCQRNELLKKNSHQIQNAWLLKFLSLSRKSLLPLSIFTLSHTFSLSLSFSLIECYSTMYIIYHWHKRW